MLSKGAWLLAIPRSYGDSGLGGNVGAGRGTVGPVEANRARIEALAPQSEFATFIEPMNFDAPNVAVICPRVRVNIPRMPMIEMRTPVVHVRTVGPGPV